jgi:hypothetical protein
MLDTIDFEFIWRMLLLTAISWVPPFVFKYIMKKIDPSDFEKVMKHTKTQKINFKIK